MSSWTSGRSRFFLFTMAAVVMVVVVVLLGWREGGSEGAMERDVKMWARERGDETKIAVRKVQATVGT